MRGWVPCGIVLARTSVVCAVSVRMATAGGLAILAPSSIIANTLLRTVPGGGYGPEKRQGEHSDVCPYSQGTDVVVGRAVSATPPVVARRSL